MICSSNIYIISQHSMTTILPHSWNMKQLRSKNKVPNSYCTPDSLAPISYISIIKGGGKHNFPYSFKNDSCAFMWYYNNSTDRSSHSLDSIILDGEFTSMSLRK